MTEFRIENLSSVTFDENEFVTSIDATVVAKDGVPFHAIIETHEDEENRPLFKVKDDILIAENRDAIHALFTIVIEKMELEGGAETPSP